MPDVDVYDTILVCRTVDVYDTILIFLTSKLKIQEKVTVDIQVKGSRDLKGS